MPSTPCCDCPALQQVFPSLRRAPIAQRRALAQLASQLIHADARIDAFEFSLAKLLETLLNDELEARVTSRHFVIGRRARGNQRVVRNLAQLGAQDEHKRADCLVKAGMTVVLPMRPHRIQGIG